MPLPRPARRIVAALLLAPALLATRAAAQGSPFVPLDDPSLPLFEYLVLRGAVTDPSPMVRPFRRAEALRVLAAADTAPASPAGRMIHRLRLRWAPPTDPTASRWSGPTWGVGARGGMQAATTPRQDLFHPAAVGGDGDVWPVLEFAGEATFGPFVLATRPVIEPRLEHDPDWPGRRDVKVLTRLADAYVSGEWRYASLVYGQVQRNWGPVGLPGFPLSDYSYERQGLAFTVGTRSLHVQAFAGDLTDETDSAGQTVHRYYFTHRLDARLSSRLHLAAWEGIIASGADREFETRYRNPLSLSYLSNALGLGDRSNVMLGLDATWRAGRHTLQAQLALDDFWYENRKNNRDRWGFTLMATGPVGPRLAYRAYYTQVSALALRTFDRFDSFTDAGVGIGRNFTDDDRLTLQALWPVTPTWLVTPELTLFRQGEGGIDVPYPPAGSQQLRDTPGLFIGTVERTWRAALGVEGRQGPFALRAEGGFHHVVNAGHVAGAVDDRFEGRLQATVGLGAAGRLRDDAD